MTSLRSHIADVLVAKDFADGVMPDRFDADEVADALLADPTLAAIIDSSLGELEYDYTPLGRKAYVMVQAWRASRAMTELVRETERLGLYDEQEPER